jgi:hypothetical protein
MRTIPTSGRQSQVCVVRGHLIPRGFGGVFAPSGSCSGMVFAWAQSPPSSRGVRVLPLVAALAATDVQGAVRSGLIRSVSELLVIAKPRGAT